MGGQALRSAAAAYFRSTDAGGQRVFLRGRDFAQSAWCLVSGASGSGAWPQHLCLDKGCESDTGWGVIVEYDYEPQIRPIRDERLPRPKRYKPRRWMVERRLAWIS
jgi:hypothetical protein